MQRRLGAVRAFAEAARIAASPADLSDAMQEISRDLGADYFLMIHHADFSHGGAGLVRLGTYPESIVRISRQDGRALDDPVMEACERTVAGFFWEEVGQLVALTDRHRRRAEAVGRTGLGDGYVVPTHLPGEPPGSCHFATACGRQIPRDNAAALLAIAAFGFDAARRLVMEQRTTLGRTAPISDRERECLILSARGKSDSVIAQLLGLRPKTVNSYIENAKARYGVATRNQLIVGALFASEITFFDIVGARG